MIWHLKELSTETYLSFSDDLKIKMNQLQFACSTDQIEEIRDWLIENTTYPYLIKKHTDSNYSWVKFVDEADATAFKLRWS